jgi:hypothetical protein
MAMDNHPMNKEKYYVWKVSVNRRDEHKHKFYISWVTDKYREDICKVDVDRNLIVFHFKFRRDSKF